MKDSAVSPPVEPKDEFLRSVWVTLFAKRRAIKNRGRLEAEFGGDAQGEWVRVIFQRANGPTVVIELMEGQFANIYLRSARRADRGKVLFRFEDIRVTGNAKRIVDVMRRTLDSADYLEATYAELIQTWESIRLKGV